MAPLFVYRGCMGLFGSRTVTQVGTSVQRVIDDTALPDSPKNGVFKSLFQDDNQIVEHILEELTSGIGLRANRMHEYGRTDYIYGLPSSTIHSSFAGQDATKAAIEAETGGPVTLAYYHFGPLNNLHFGWMTLVQDYGYQASTNELLALSAIKGNPVYLSDMVVHVQEATQAEIENGSLDTWGTPPNAGYTPASKVLSSIGNLVKGSTYVVDSTGSDHFEVTYCWIEKTTVTVDGVPINRDVLHEESLTFPFTGFDLEASYHQAKYVTGEGNTGYWTYQMGTGAHPNIDSVFDAAYSETGSYFPWAYFRFDKTSMGDAPLSPEYLSSKKLMKTLNLDYGMLVDNINNNPDIADVEQAMMIMAVPAVTTNRLEQRYLFDFFTGLCDASKEQTDDFNNLFNSTAAKGMFAKLSGQINGTGVIIQDRRFKMALNFQSAVRHKVATSIGVVGSYSSGKDGNSYWYRHQITETLCEEVIITGLRMTYYVWGDYTTTGDENNEEILLIPVDRTITDHYSIPDREVLYTRSLHYVFNSRVVTKLKWYQTGLFKVVMIVAAIVLTVLSYGTTWESVAAAIAAGTMTMEAFLTMVLIGVLKYVATMLAIRLFVKEVGAKLALIAAIVAAIIGGYQAIEAGGFDGAPMAKDLLSISTSLAKGVSEKVKGDFNDLLADYNEFQHYVEDQTKLLDDANALLNHGARLDPLVIFGESPQEFYQRTVHSGNIGVLGIDAIESYVDVALQLPKLSDSLGESYA